MQESLPTFMCYADEDEDLAEELGKHLKLLQYNNIIAIRSHKNFSPGSTQTSEITGYIGEAKLILLLISTDFIASNYCYKMAMPQALNKAKQGEARVIPIVLRPVDIEIAPFRTIQSLPANGKAVNSSHWHTRDEAWQEIAKSISTIAHEERKTSNIVINSASKASDATNRQGTAIAIEERKNPSTSAKNASKTTYTANKPSSVVAQENHKPAAIPSPPLQDNGNQSAIGKTLFKYRMHKYPITALAWSPKGQTIASGDEQGIVRVWRHSDGHTFLTKDCGKAFGTNLDSFRIQELLWSPNGQYLAVRMGTENLGKVGVWNVFQAKESLLTSPIRKCMAWSPNSKYLAIGTFELFYPLIQLWKMEYSGSSTLQASYSEHGKIATAQTLLKHAFESFVSQGNPLNQITSIAWSPNGARVASSDSYGAIHHWDLTGKNNRIYQEQASASDLRLSWSPSDEGKYLLSGDQNGTISVWNSANGQKTKTFLLDKKPVHQLSIVSQGELLLASSHLTDYQCTIWSTKSSDKLYSTNNPGVPSPNGSYFAAFGKNAAIQLKTIETRIGQVYYTYREHTGSIDQLAWSPDERFIASCSRDHEINVWQAR